MVAHWHLFAGHLIAQNVSAPTVLLEHPTMENWENEIRKGYDYVGITSLTPYMEDCLEMFRVVRRLSPQSQTIFGFIPGFDFHERRNVLDDIWWMVHLEPTMAQVTRVTPYPGTPIYERLQEEGRIKPFTWDEVSFYGGDHVPKNFTVHELMSLITTADKLLYETWGPPSCGSSNWT